MIHFYISFLINNIYVSHIQYDTKIIFIIIAIKSESVYRKLLFANQNNNASITYAIYVLFIVMLAKKCISEYEFNMLQCMKYFSMS